MKKIILVLCIIFSLTISSLYAADQWDKTDPAGTSNAADIDANIIANNGALDRLLYVFREDCRLTYASASTLTVRSGSLALPNADGLVVRWRRNTSNTTVAWTEIDTGAEAASTTYYIYGVADTDATTFTCLISTNSSAPTGATYYRRLGSFYNDASSNITNISNDNFPFTLYDSGWFAVATATSYSKTHSLGTIKIIPVVFWSASSDGSSAEISNTYEQSGNQYGLQIKAITATTLKVQAGADGVHATYIDSTGEVTGQTSGYARVLAVVLE